MHLRDKIQDVLISTPQDIKMWGPVLHEWTASAQLPAPWVEGQDFTSQFQHTSSYGYLHGWIEWFIGTTTSEVKCTESSGKDTITVTSETYVQLSIIWTNLFVMCLDGLCKTYWVPEVKLLCKGLVVQYDPMQSNQLA